MRVMAVDYGDTRTGVAFSDATGTLAGESLVITEYSAGRLAEKLAALYHSRGARRAGTATSAGRRSTRLRRR